MEIKEILSKLTIPIKPKINEDDQIKNEENNITEVIMNVNFDSILVLSKKNKFCTIRI